VTPPTGFGRPPVPGVTPPDENGRLPVDGGSSLDHFVPTQDESGTLPGGSDRRSNEKGERTSREGPSPTQVDKRKRVSHTTVTEQQTLTTNDRRFSS
jgi:hypothetical protein